MRLYKCHAVLPATGRDRAHPVRTYVTVARTWREARARVRGAEPTADFVSLPCEAPDPVMMQGGSMNAQELAALRLACDWNEAQQPKE